MVTGKLEIRGQPTYFVVFFQTKFSSMEDVKSRMPEVLLEHVGRSNALYKDGKVLMAGAFRDDTGGMVSTMALFYSRQDAEEYVRNDPFVLSGMVSEWTVKAWANILKE